MGSGEGTAAPAGTPAAGEAKAARAASLPTPAAQVAASEAFRNLRRDDWFFIKNLSVEFGSGGSPLLRGSRRHLGQLVEVDSGVPSFARAQQLFPGDLAPRVGCTPSHHGTEAGLGAVSRLVVEFPAQDAFGESLLFLRVGLVEGAFEDAGGRELPGFLLRLATACVPFPGVIAGDADGVVIVRLGNTFAAEEALAHVPPAFVKLGGIQAHMHVVGIGQQHLEVVPAVAAVGSDLAAAGGRRLQRVPLEDPVADVHHVDVLLHQDVAREHAVIYPVANPALDGRSIRPGGAVDRARVVVGLTASDFPERAAMDALRQLDKRRGVADLGSYVQADLAPRLLSDSDALFGAVAVHRHRLFA